jgi:hypothetical protein
MSCLFNGDDVGRSFALPTALHEGSLRTLIRAIKRT